MACNLHNIEDEFHFFFRCPAYACIRTTFYNNLRFLRASSGNIPSVTDFLAFI